MRKIIIIPLMAAAAAVMLAGVLLGGEKTDLTKAHGTVDIQDSLLSFERAGKIIKLNATEGSVVRKGDILAALDPADLEHQQRIRYAMCNAETALLEQYRNGYLTEEKESAMAAVKGAEAAVSLARITYERNSRLLKDKAVSRQDYDSSRAAYEQALATLADSRAQLSLVNRGYRDEMISAQSAKVSACNAELAYLNYKIDTQGYIRAPFDGTVRSRVHEISDYVGAGETIYALTDESVKKIRLYLSEQQLALVKTGQSVKVLLRSDGSVDGTVSFISPTAVFTPKSVQTEDLRADLVYEVNVSVKDPERLLRFGQAVTVRLTDQESLQRKRNDGKDV